jgi:serine phosphatase RsbU (regulator of sigma subunit)
VSYPADETGGDFFDYVDMLDGTLGIVVADVSSHGLGSALLMAETRAYFRALALSYDDVGEILTRANRILFADTEGKHFVTAFFAKLDPRARTLTYAAAGHAGYWIEASGATTRLDGTSLPLGIERELVVPVAPAVTLRSGDVAFICTDGIQEAHSPAREMFGSRRTLETVRRHLGQSADEIVRGLYDAVTKHTAGRPPNDDITAVAVKRK